MENKALITTDSGFTCSIDTSAMDDMRIMDALIDLQNGTRMEQIVALRTILERLLGKDQKDALYEHLEAKTGRAGTIAVQAELLDIFNKIGEAGKK